MILANFGLSLTWKQLQLAKNMKCRILVAKNNIAQGWWKSIDITITIMIKMSRYQAVLHLTEERGRQDHGLTLDSGIYVSRYHHYHRLCHQRQHCHLYHYCQHHHDQHCSFGYHRCNHYCPCCRHSCEGRIYCIVWKYWINQKIHFVIRAIWPLMDL